MECHIGKRQNPAILQNVPFPAEPCSLWGQFLRHTAESRLEGAWLLNCHSLVFAVVHCISRFLG